MGPLHMEFHMHLGKEKGLIGAIVAESAQKWMLTVGGSGSQPNGHFGPI